MYTTDEVDHALQSWSILTVDTAEYTLKQVTAAVAVGGAV